MVTRCISSRRDLIIKILQEKTGEMAIFHPSPGFTVSVGSFSLYRDGRLMGPDSQNEIFQILSRLELCKDPYLPEEEESHEAWELPPFAYPMSRHDGRSLLNLFGILSYGQLLLNQALDSKGAFFVAPSLTESLYAHPPKERIDFLRAIYGREEEYRGIIFHKDYFAFSGFGKCPVKEAAIHNLLGDLLTETAVSRNWVKPKRSNVRNRKYAFRSFLIRIGMTGPQYEEMRQIMLSRLYGKSNQRRITAPKGGSVHG